MIQQLSLEVFPHQSHYCVIVTVPHFIETSGDSVVSNEIWNLLNYVTI